MFVLNNLIIKGYEGRLTFPHTLLRSSTSDLSRPHTPIPKCLIKLLNTLENKISSDHLKLYYKKDLITAKYEKHGKPRCSDC